MNSTYDAVFKVIETDVEFLAKAINQAISDSDELQIINDFLTELKSLLDDANNEAVKIIRTGMDQQDSIIERMKTLKVLYRTIQLQSKRYERTLNNTATSSLNSSRVASNVSTPSIIRQALENLPLRRQTESLTRSTTTQNVTMDQDTPDDLPQFSGLPAILNATSSHRSNSAQDNSGLLLRPGSNSDANYLGSSHSSTTNKNSWNSNCPWNSPPSSIKPLIEAAERRLVPKFKPSAEPPRSSTSRNDYRIEQWNSTPNRQSAIDSNSGTKTELRSSTS